MVWLGSMRYVMWCDVLIRKLNITKLCVRVFMYICFKTKSLKRETMMTMGSRTVSTKNTQTLFSAIIMIILAFILFRQSQFLVSSSSLSSSLSKSRYIEKKLCHSFRFIVLPLIHSPNNFGLNTKSEKSPN